MSMKAVALRTMRAEDFSAADALWRNTPGMGLDPLMDSQPAITAYLSRNAGMSAVAVATETGEVIGTVLAGTDGRRGYLMHLAVREDFRRRGIGKSLVERSLEALKVAGINKAHVFVFQSNVLGAAFWRGLGWQSRDDLLMLSWSMDTPEAPAGNTRG